MQKQSVFTVRLNLLRKSFRFSFFDQYRLFSPFFRASREAKNRFRLYTEIYMSRKVKESDVIYRWPLMTGFTVLLSTYVYQPTIASPLCGWLLRTCGINCMHFLPDKKWGQINNNSRLYNPNRFILTPIFSN